MRNSANLAVTSFSSITELDSETVLVCVSLNPGVLPPDKVTVSDSGSRERLSGLLEFDSSDDLGVGSDDEIEGSSSVLVPSGAILHALSKKWIYKDDREIGMVTLTL